MPSYELHVQPSTIYPSMHSGVLRPDDITMAVDNFGFEPLEFSLTACEGCNNVFLRCARYDFRYEIPEWVQMVASNYCPSCLGDSDWATYCEGCRQYYPESYMLTDVVRGSNDLSWCDDCCENYTNICEDCDRRYSDSCYCERSQTDQYVPRSSRYDRFRATSCEVSFSDEVPVAGLPTFGVEVESEWDGDAPYTGEYHGYHETEPPFLSGWRAETDGSLSNGCEFISPPLLGAAGMAEVSVMLDIVHREGGSMRGSCGQHVHIGHPDRDSAWRPQVVTAVVEDFLIATTGSWKRWYSTYAPHVKDQRLPEWIRQNHQRRRPEQINGYRCTSSATDYGTVEFRYPTGTLNDTQFALNLGLCQMVMRLGRDTDIPTLRGMALGAAMNFEEYRNLTYDVHPEEQDLRRATWDMVSRSVLISSQLLRENGLSSKQAWRDLPYDTLNPPTCIVVDVSRGIKHEVELPGQRDLMKRLRRQIGRFTMRAANDLLISPREAEAVSTAVLDTFR